MSSLKFDSSNITKQLAELFVELCKENLTKQYPYAPGYNLSESVTGNQVKNNTGALSNSINIIEGEGETSIELEDYGLVVNFGRRPGLKQPPTAPIEKWLQQRGIQGEGISQKSLAFLIARSIGRKGIAPTNFIDDAIGDLAVITSDPLDPRNPFNQQDVTEEVTNFINTIFQQLTQ